jgi:hypothetical protein
MHQFRSKMLRPPLLAASSFMSNPIGPYSLETRLGGFPAAIFCRMILPDAPVWIRMPLTFPVMLFCSIRLLLLVPIRPTPKSLFDATVGGAAHSAAAHG